MTDSYSQLLDIIASQDKEIDRLQEEVRVANKGLARWSGELARIRATTDTQNGQSRPANRHSANTDAVVADAAGHAARDAWFRAVEGHETVHVEPPGPWSNWPAEARRPWVSAAQAAVSTTYRFNGSAA